MTTRNLVLIVGPTPPPYAGMTVATEILVQALGKRVEYVHLDTSDRRGLANAGRLDFGNVFLAALHGLQYLWLLVTKRPRMVYIPIAQAWLPFLRDCLFLIPARLTRRTIVVHLHGGYFARFYRDSSPVMRWMVRFALAKTKIAIVLGKDVARIFDGILPADRVRIVPNGIPDEFHGEALKKAKQGAAELLFLGTLKAEKGTLDLLRALPQIKKGADSVRVVFGGEWCSEHDRQVASHTIAAHHLEANVEFMGPVVPERKPDLFAGADILVLPTYNEGQPYVILEAMAAGLPVVSTTVGCIPETVQDGVHGFLVSPGDVAALAERVNYLLQDAGLRKRMGEEARCRFVAEYTHDKFAERMMAVFVEALQ